MLLLSPRTLLPPACRHQPGRRVAQGKGAPSAEAGERAALRRQQQGVQGGAAAGRAAVAGGCVGCRREWRRRPAPNSCSRSRQMQCAARGCKQQGASGGAAAGCKKVMIGGRHRQQAASAVQQQTVQPGPAAGERRASGGSSCADAKRHKASGGLCLQLEHRRRQEARPLSSCAAGAGAGSRGRLATLVADAVRACCSAPPVRHCVQ